MSARASPADRRVARSAGKRPFVRWTKLPCLRPLGGLQAAGSLPNRRRCWGQGPRRWCARLPPSQHAVPVAGKPNSATTSRGRRLFPSSLRGPARPGGIAWAGEDSCGAATGSAEASTKTRIALRRRGRASPKSRANAHLCQIAAVCLFYITSLPASGEHSKNGVDPGPAPALSGEVLLPRHGHRCIKTTNREVGQRKLQNQSDGSATHERAVLAFRRRVLPGRGGYKRSNRN